MARCMKQIAPLCPVTAAESRLQNATPSHRFVHAALKGLQGDPSMGSKRMKWEEVSPLLQAAKEDLSEFCQTDRRTVVEAAAAVESRMEQIAAEE